MMRSGNPALRDDVFGVPSSTAYGSKARGNLAAAQQLMTVQGTVNKSFLLLALVVATASLTWWKASTGDLAFTQMAMMGGLIGGLIFALITIFKKSAANVTAPLYALCQGFALGGISVTYEMRFPGIVIEAVGLTFAVFLGLLFVYKSRLIRATDNFKLGVAAATGGIALMYLVTLVLSLFGVNVPFIHDSGPIGIGISLVIVVVAALNLVMDFDFIEQGEATGAPKFMEWYAAFGLLVTLVWLYLEMLRLLSKLQRRD